MVGGGECVGSGISCQWMGWGGWMIAWLDDGILEGEKPSFYIERWGIFADVNSNWGICAGGSLNHVFWLVRIIWRLNHVSWLVRAESCTLIGQNMMTENMWTEPWIVIGQNLMTENIWAEPWVVIGQNLRTKNMWAEPWVMIGQNLMSESCKMIGHNLMAESWILIGSY